jgi:hypothetical protein
LTHSQEGKWIYSTDNETFTTGDYFDTKELAIEGGKAEYTWQSECPVFYVGQVKSVGFSIYVDPDSILERIAESVYDEVGEVAADYLNDVEKEHFQTLEDELNDVVRKWMDKYGYNPTFFSVVNIEKVSS